MRFPSGTNDINAVSEFFVNATKDIKRALNKCNDEKHLPHFRVGQLHSALIFEHCSARFPAMATIIHETSLPIRREPTGERSFYSLFMNKLIISVQVSI
jgi:hypothetical protein